MALCLEFIESIFFAYRPSERSISPSSSTQSLFGENTTKIITDLLFDLTHFVHPFLFPSRVQSENNEEIEGNEEKEEEKEYKNPNKVSVIAGSINCIAYLAQFYPLLFRHFFEVNFAKTKQKQIEENLPRGFIYYFSYSIIRKLIKYNNRK